MRMHLESGRDTRSKKPSSYSVQGIFQDGPGNPPVRDEQTGCQVLNLLRKSWIHLTIVILLAQVHTLPATAPFAR